jgi:hypothetical protein
MGDKNPKAAQKQASQKASHAKAETDRRQKAMTDKQGAPKKK